MEDLNETPASQDFDIFFKNQKREIYWNKIYYKGVKLKEIGVWEEEGEELHWIIENFPNAIKTYMIGYGLYADFNVTSLKDSINPLIFENEQVIVKISAKSFSEGIKIALARNHIQLNKDTKCNLEIKFKRVDKNKIEVSYIKPHYPELEEANEIRREYDPNKTF